MLALLALEVGESEPVGGVDDQVEHRPAQTQATRLAREKADRLGPTAHFFKRSRASWPPRASTLVSTLSKIA